MQPNTPEQKRVALSLLKADLDMEAAGVLLQGSPHLHENVGFHCQQAVGKYAKALLVASKLPTPFIHDLTKLLPPLHQAGIVQFTANTSPARPFSMNSP